MNVITDGDVVRHSDRTRQNAAFADDHAAGNTDTGYDRRILADLTVMADLNQIIDNNPIGDDGIANSATVYCRDRADRTS